MLRFRDGLVEQRFQADGVAFSGLERPSVGAQDRAEGDVLEVELVVPPPPSDREELLEMVALAVIDHVENLLGIPGLGPVLDGRQVGRAVIESTIALADDEWGRGLGGEDDNRPLALLGDTSCRDVFDDRGQHRIVEAFAQLDIEPHAQPVVDLPQRLQAVRHELVPECTILRISGMQLGGLGRAAASTDRSPALIRSWVRRYSRASSATGSAANAASSLAFFQPQRIIPNCDPQSPRWLSRIT